MTKEEIADYLQEMIVVDSSIRDETSLYNWRKIWALAAQAAQEDYDTLGSNVPDEYGPAAQNYVEKEQVSSADRDEFKEYYHKCYDFYVIIGDSLIDKISNAVKEEFDRVDHAIKKQILFEENHPLLAKIKEIHFKSKKSADEDSEIEEDRTFTEAPADENLKKKKKKKSFARRAIKWLVVVSLVYGGWKLVGNIFDTKEQKSIEQEMEDLALQIPEEERDEIRISCLNFYKNYGWRMYTEEIDLTRMPSSPLDDREQLKLAFNQFDDNQKASAMTAYVDFYETLEPYTKEQQENMNETLIHAKLQGLAAALLRNRTQALYSQYGENLGGPELYAKPLENLEIISLAKGSGTDPFGNPIEYVNGNASWLVDFYTNEATKNILDEEAAKFVSEQAAQAGVATFKAAHPQESLKK